MAATSFESCLKYPTTENFASKYGLIQRAESVIKAYKANSTNACYILTYQSHRSSISYKPYPSSTSPHKQVMLLFHEKCRICSSVCDDKFSYLILSNKDRKSTTIKKIVKIFCNQYGDLVKVDHFPFHFWPIEKALPSILVYSTEGDYVYSTEKGLPPIFVDGTSSSSTVHAGEDKSVSSPQEIKARSLDAMKYLFIQSTAESVHSIVYPSLQKIDFEEAVNDYFDNLALRQLGRLGFAKDPKTWCGDLKDFSIEKVNQIQKAADTLFVWKEIGTAIGSVPDFSAVSSYDGLIAYRNQFKDWIQKHKAEVSKLDVLKLDYTCFLTSLPEEIGELKGLRELILTENLCVTLPDSICQLTNLEKLDVTWNRLTKLPEDLGKLTKLKVLNASHNKLSFLPGSICELKVLKELILFDNALTASPKIPPCVQKLDIRNNFIPASTAPTPIKQTEASSIVPFDDMVSHVVRKLPVPYEEFRFTDDMGRTKSDREFLKQFERIFFAAAYGNLPECQKIVEEGFRDFEATYHGNGANFSKKGKYDNKSPLQIAKDNGRADIVAFFEKISSGA